jgi:hypothetical protein
MIIKLLVEIVLGLVAPLLSLASFSAPAVGDLSGAAAIGSSIGQANRYLPIDQFLILIVAGLAFDLVLSGGQFLVFVYRLIPLKFT